MNYLSIFVTTVLVFMLGWLWYSPVLFGNVWMKLMKIDKKKMEKGKKDMMKNMWKVMLGGFFVTFVLIFMTDLFLNFLNVTTLSQGLILGSLVWVGFMATTMFNTVLYEGKSFKLYLINAGHYLVVMLLAGGLLAVWA